MTRDEVWPTFDAWCLEHGIEPLELPADRWLNLIEYFATRNMDEQKRKEWDNHIASINMEWIKLKLEKVSPSSSDASGGSKSGSDGSTRSTQSDQQRARRLPPKPPWYGSRDNATRDSLMAKSMLTSRNGVKRR